MKKFLKIKPNKTKKSSCINKIQESPSDNVKEVAKSHWKNVQKVAENNWKNVKGVNMKVIDLLNMIANGEEMPERIKYNDDILEYKKVPQDYTGIKLRTGYFFTHLFMNNNTRNFINNEVELLEDEEIDIQDIKEPEYIDAYGVDTADIKSNRDMIIQLTRAVKQLDNKLKGN